MCPCCVRRRLGIADSAAEEGEDGERLDPERVVVELVGEPERCTGVLERSGEALPEAGRPRELALDARLQRRPRLRLAQGLLEQRDRPVETLELGEEGESLGAQRTDVALCQQVREDRAGARPFSGGPMRTSCGQGSTTALVACLRRRQPDRLLGELGSDRR